MSDWTNHPANEEEKVGGEGNAPVSGETPATPPQEPSVSAAPVYEHTAYEAPTYQNTANEWHSAATPEPPREEPAAENTTPPQTDWTANPYRNGTAPTPPQTPPTPPRYANSWYHSGRQGGGSYTPPPQTPVWQSPSPQPPKKKHTGVIVALAVVGVIAAILLGISLVLAIFGTVKTEEKPTTNEGQNEIIDNDAPSLNITDWSDDDGGLAASEVANRNLDSTVVIAIYQMKSAGNNFGAFYGFGAETLTQVGSASGIIMSEDGYIITNWHVVTDEQTGKLYDRVDVTTYDGTTYEDAKVIGADRSTDLAVIKIDATDLTVAQFGDSSKLVIGDRVLALGNAGGLQWSATQGIVSGLARDVYEDTGYSIKCLQTDAAINPGNSGGPLINNKGQVIGINSAKIAASGYEGLGFSIPINEAKDIIDDLVKYGYVKGRVQLGVTGYTVNSNGYKGYVIKTIDENADLANTKARVGDLITAVDGVKIDGYGTLRAQLSKHAVGDSVTLTLLRLNSRTGEETTFTVTCKLAESK